MAGAKRAVAHETLFLNHSVSRLLRGDQYLAVLRRKLVDHGILRVGQLIQLTERELLEKLPRTSPAVVDRVVERLANVDLKLGMHVNGWRNPDDLPPPKNTGACRKKVSRAAHVVSRKNTVRRSGRKPSAQS